jgi:hypothetical protein
MAKVWLSAVALLLAGCNFNPGSGDASYAQANGDGGFLRADGGVVPNASLAARLGQRIADECDRAALGTNVADLAYVEVGRLGDAQPFFQWFPRNGKNPDSKMYIASASKWVSGVAIVETLAAANRPLSTPLLRKSTSAQGFAFLDEVKPWSPHLERITVEHLLAFSSGLHVKRQLNGALVADTWDDCAGDKNSTDRKCAVEALSETWPADLQR